MATETSGSIAFLSDLLPSPRMPSPRNPSPCRTENFSPARSDSPGLATTAHRRTTIGTGELSMPDFTSAYTRTFNTESGTAGMSLDHRLSNTPEELYYCLEEDSRPPGLSLKYLQKSSPSAAMVDASSYDGLSLSQILEGRTRKLCARMFYEVLVLNSCGLIDVQQDQAYGDVKLILTPTNSKINDEAT